MYHIFSLFSADDFFYSQARRRCQELLAPLLLKFQLVFNPLLIFYRRREVRYRVSRDLLCQDINPALIHPLPRNPTLFFASSQCGSPVFSTFPITPSTTPNLLFLLWFSFSAVLAIVPFAFLLNSVVCPPIRFLSSSPLLSKTWGVFGFWLGGAFSFIHEFPSFRSFPSSNSHQLPYVPWFSLQRLSDSTQLSLLSFSWSLISLPSDVHSPHSSCPLCFCFSQF